MPLAPGEGLSQLHPRADATAQRQGIVEEQIEHAVFQQRPVFAEDGDHAGRARRPVAGHEPRQDGVSIGHLDRKRQVPDVLEERQEHGDVVVLQVSFADHQVQHIQAADKRPGGNRYDLDGGNEGQRDTPDLPEVVPEVQAR